ncbi:sulfite exporter TauE/SafE family protein [Faunimonas sp. B44]|uniref:sulfite exporter TauE/SafE family protein n=1 Tax=Faunimonas sp. B44 TaxID=3461493 RepID=UPI004044ABFA
MAGGFPLGLDLWQQVYLALCILGAAWVRGYSGFGFSALVVTSAAVVTDPVPLVATLIMCEILLSLGQARGLRAQADWRRVAGMLAGATLVMPFSFALLARLGEDPARIAISATVLVMCVAMARGWSFGRNVGTAGNVVAGMVSGVANGAAVGGLPVAVFLSGQPVAAPVFRGTMIAYLTLICIIALPSLWMTGLLRGSSFVLLAVMAPLMALGLWIGGRRFIASTPCDFRRFTLSLLGILSVLGLLRSIW